jgi:transcriptional regulator with XRE-family HTH domain
VAVRNEMLRLAMSQAGQTMESLAGRVGVDPKTVSRWVNTGRVPHPRTRMRVAAVLRREAAELWPEPFRRRDMPWFRPWVGLERDATSLRSYEPLLVPGLLQTEAYARAVLRVGGLLSEVEVEQLLVGRMARQEILSGDRPPQLVAVFDEMALRRLVGDRAVMAAQCDHLVAVADSEYVRIRVIPADGPCHAGLAGAFVIARLSDGTQAAHVDGQLRGHTVDESVDLAGLDRRWEAVTGEALSRRQSTELIREVARAWR